MNICRCGHREEIHGKGRDSHKIVRRLSCTFYDSSFRFCRCEEYRESNLTEEGVTVMAKKEGSLVVRYEVTAKDGAKLLDKENQAQSAVMYRALAAAGEPLTIAETYKRAKCESQAEYERLGKNQNSSLFALRKAGFVKKQERREEVAKPKVVRKRKPSTKKAKTSEAASSAAAETAAA